MSNIDKRALTAGTYAILFRDNWDGEGDVYETLAMLSDDLVWYHYENGRALIEYEGDEVLKAWPLDDGGNVLALLDELEAKDKYLELEREKSRRVMSRIAELEAREVRLPPTLWYEHDELPREIPVLSRRLVINTLRDAGIALDTGE
ncbi:hypothetical protein ACG0Z5_10865 [Scandinavium sp. M-37]|uniref:hypothetical protein n=1 Tax=Scandinavium sp. M-37 TaxID=3373077 RepID=UPI003746B5B2